MVRSSNPEIIMKDIKGAFERTITEVIQEINTMAKDKTPYLTGHAQKSWKAVSKYKLGAITQVIKNDAKYIGLLDGVLGKPTSDKAPDGIINPKLNNNMKTILTKKRKIK